MRRLSNLQVKHAKPGRHADGQGLYLFVKPSGTKSWVLRVQVGNRRRDFGIGSTDIVTLTEARNKAAAWRKAAKEGRDPSAEARIELFGAHSFRQAAIQYHDAIKAGWKNAKHGAQWLATLEAHVFGKLGGISVKEIDAAAIQATLLPIWLSVPETARRVRQRIGAVLDYAHSQGWRDSEAPMRAVAKGLPQQPKQTGHFAAMPHADLPNFMGRLRSKELSVGCTALQFLILTSARSGEVRGAEWDEIDTELMTWTIPALRMKAGIEHVVPLTDDAIALIELAKVWRSPTHGLIFPGQTGKPLSDMTLSKVLKSTSAGFTVHGFRSTFRDWVAETLPSVPGAVAEAALAHTVPNKVEAAYRRTKFIEQRRDLMQKWADFLAGESAQGHPLSISSEMIQ